MTNSTQTCLTPECIKVSADILSSADMSADPCTDFYQVCNHPHP